ncbi:PilW family protein [Cocleimonas sp. KMM 6892]|uniref:PilW family protein n=1 Tax=unclassified Cocleimonas TaxID=2639732 RepID=UPI002DBEE5B6|nr:MULTISPECIES: PilW family protein [unclassified Cocleimonas]MEB8433620.1 PilW family protein [Cocleimonas sp. KMM 6892]MEC4716431.1 PilW family protein [Cocleimonas sp. KMM 6895]MEC4745676.1 PilW family protein [Cocleimonas sp. KMM 6896]
MQKIIKNNSSLFKGKSGLQAQSGLSMVELLVSMVIGLFLLAGVVTNFVGTKDSDRMRDAISEMDGNARSALELIRKTIMHAGYPSIHSKIIDKPFYTDADGPLDNPVCRNGVTLENQQPSWNRKTRDGASDLITVAALADNPCISGVTECTNSPANYNSRALVYFDCTGGGTLRDQRAVACSADPVNGIAPPFQPSDAKIYSTFRVVRNTSSVDDDRVLFCHGSRGGTQPIIENVESIQFLYGVQRDDGSINYQRAGKVEDRGEWESIVSVQVGLLLRSSNDNLLKEDSSVTFYNVLDKKVNISSNDLRRLFRVYTTTVYLANKSSGRILNAGN